jgi:glycolate oxidase iron-sulfur subunit
LQPTLATQLRERKLGNIGRTGADVVATGNVGCIAHLAAGVGGGAGTHDGVPVVHTVELLDWATGGPRPPALASSNIGAAAIASGRAGGES